MINYCTHRCDLKYEILNNFLSVLEKCEIESAKCFELHFCTLHAYVTMYIHYIHTKMHACISYITLTSKTFEPSPKKTQM